MLPRQYGFGRLRSKAMAFAQTNLGVLYRDGRGVTQEPC